MALKGSIQRMSSVLLQGCYKTALKNDQRMHFDRFMHVVMMFEGSLKEAPSKLPGCFKDVLRTLQ